MIHIHGDEVTGRCVRAYVCVCVCVCVRVRVRASESNACADNKQSLM